MTESDMITPVLLCGGSGTRLWPLSRGTYPKQFAPLVGDGSLFQAAAGRLSGPDFTAPIVLTNARFRFIVTEQLAEIGIDPGAVLIEPEGRNTAPAVLAAALWMARETPDALMLISPSDHVMPDVAAFRDVVASAAPAARDGRIVTFGITPDRAETGYGYLELSHPVDDQTTVSVPLERFVEKPDVARAEQMVASGRFLWNSGMFLFSPATILEAFRAHAPEMLAPTTRAIDEGQSDLGFFRLAPGPWKDIPDLSVDYAVMEKVANLSVVPFRQHWSDLGGWDAVWREEPKDENGVVTSGAATAIDCTDTLLRSEAQTLELVGLGLDNIVAVAMPDAVLVADRSRTQEVRLAIDALSMREARQASEFTKDHRPWGWFESLATGGRFQVKRIVVKPGAALSLQSHHHRAEHWIVVEGTARVTIGETEQLLSENQSVYVPLGAVHRLENPGHLPVVLIEVQTGSYLGEDDIVRYEDVYARK